MDTSVPGQQDASDAALVDMLMLEAPVGLALFGSDLRFRWVNAALTRLSERSGEDPSAPSDPHPDPSAWAGIERDDRLRLPGLRAQLAGAERITIVNTRTGAGFTATCVLTPREREILLSGGILAHTRAGRA